MNFKTKGLLGVAIVLATPMVLRLIHRTRINRRLAIIQQVKAEQLRRQMPKSTDLNAEERNILSMSSRMLLSALRDGHIQPSTVMLAFIKQATAAHQQFNCITEAYFNQALAEAQHADTIPLNERAQRPLFGLPISLKDSVNLKGVDSSLGLMRYCQQPAHEDAVIVRAMRTLGAIPFVKSAIPQTMISFECLNPVFGRTVNPWNRDFSCGGSSGGEGALLGARGSILGVGTDIGGSVRFPAAFCGAFGFKPTHRRLTLRGFRPAVPGQEAVPGICGLMSSDFNALDTSLRALLSNPCLEMQCQADPEIVPAAFSNSESKSEPHNRRVGLYIPDFPPLSPAVRRALDTTAQALQSAGYEVVEWKLPESVIFLSL